MQRRKNLRGKIPRAVAPDAETNGISNHRLRSG